MKNFLEETTMTDKEYICTAPKEHTMNCGWTHKQCENCKFCKEIKRLIMPDKLHCPFCGVELKGWEEKHLGEFWACANDKCTAFGKLKGTFSMWQALINAQDALKVAIQELNSLIEPVNSQDDYRNSILTQFGLNRAINEIKRKITSITKQGE